MKLYSILIIQKINKELLSAFENKSQIKSSLLHTEKVIDSLNSLHIVNWNNTPINSFKGFYSLVSNKFKIRSPLPIISY
jgi:hypothetical protein